MQKVPRGKGPGEGKPKRQEKNFERVVNKKVQILAYAHAPKWNIADICT